MELLSTEFINLARSCGLTDEQIVNLIGGEFFNLKITSEQDVTWREIPNSETLKKFVTLLTHAEPELVLQIIKKRTILQTYQLKTNTLLNEFSLLGKTPHYTLRLETFSNYSDFDAFLTRNYLDYPAMDFQNTSVRHLTADAFQVLTLLIELFVEKYPSPETNWEPEELLTFTAASLKLILEDSYQRIGENTWYQHWKRMTGKKDPNEESIELGMAYLAQMELIGYLDDVDGQDVFFVGETLTWYIRGIAWWDRGFSIQNKNQKTVFTLFEASALFVLISEGEDDFSLFNIDGKTLQSYIKRYLEISMKSKEETQSKAETSTVVSKFCSQCGSKIETEARFCHNCGNQIAF